MKEHKITIGWNALKRLLQGKKLEIGDKFENPKNRYTVELTKDLDDNLFIGIG